MILEIMNYKKLMSRIKDLLKYWKTSVDIQKIQQRVVLKQGNCNVVQKNVVKLHPKYLQDIVTTLIDSQWRWILLIFPFYFLVSWLLFAFVWWFISYTHGDLLEEHINGTKPWTPCITNIHGFTSSFLFSVETQHALEYAGRARTEECPETIFVLCLQNIGGVIVQGFMAGVIFAKLLRPKKRSQNLLFSKNAVIGRRGGVPCLMFRIGDLKKRHIIGSCIKAQFITYKIANEDDNLSFSQTELKVSVDSDREEDKVFFIWPTLIVHRIDKSSPLYNISATDLLRERFEIIVILEGVIESTGMTTQARSSYLPSEILWGHHFQSLITFKKESGEYEVDYTLFNSTIEVDTPLCSAKQLDEYSDECVDHLKSELFPSIRTYSSDILYSMDSQSIDDHIVIETETNTIPGTVTSPDETIEEKFCD